MTEIYTEYADAFFMLALEEKKTAEYYGELEGITSLIADTPEYEEFLASPSIAVGERTAALKAALEGSFSEYTVNFLLLLCEKGRIRLLPEILAEYKRLLEEYRRSREAIVRSAVALSESEKKALSEKLGRMTGDHVEIVNITDKTVLGGLVIEIDGKVIDGSVKGRLADMKGVISK